MPWSVWCGKDIKYLGLKIWGEQWSVILLSPALSHYITILQCNITISKKALNQVSEFRYLGSIFTKDGKLGREIETRIQKANNINYQTAPILKHQNVTMQTKKKLIDALHYATNAKHGHFLKAINVKSHHVRWDVYAMLQTKQERQ